MTLDRETLLELQGLLDESEYWVREQIPASEWRIFSRVYDTRSSFLKSCAKIQRRISQALATQVSNAS